MGWEKVANQLKLHDISIIFGGKRSGKTQFLVEQYGDTPFALDVSKAKLAYCGGDTSITEEEWQSMLSRDCPFIAVDDAHLLKSADILKLIDVAFETKKRLYLACSDTITSHLPAILTYAEEFDLSVVKLERLTPNDVCAWTLAEFG